MADVKVSGLPSDSSLDGNHYVPVNDPTGPTTKRTLLSTLAAFFFNQINIPDGSGSPRTRYTENEVDGMASGGLWTGDAYASTRNASMTALVIYINGRRISISAVVARSFTASKDTYIDVLDNADGTGTLVYSEVTNGAASPSLAANSVRLGYIVTGASNIAALTSIYQFGQDSLGNLMFPKTVRQREMQQCHLASGTSARAGSASAVANGGIDYPFNEAVEELYDPSGMHSISSNPERITVQVPGIYEIAGMCYWPDSSVNVRILDLSLNGSTTVGSARNAQDANGRSAQELICTVPLRQGDYVKLTTYQNTGGNFTPTAVTFRAKLIA